MKPKTAILLINLGTPDSPGKFDVRKYLTQFLNDPRVIDIPWLLRKILVNLFIVPFRSTHSSNLYKQIWDKNTGSPLLMHSENLKEKLQASLGEDYQVGLAMRYQNPKMKTVLERMQKESYHKIIAIPLFPQYASSSTGSAAQHLMEIVSKWWVIPEIKIISQFYDNPDFINCIVSRAKQLAPSSYDHIVFSYHGLPERQVAKVHQNDTNCRDHNCEKEINADNYYCYKSACYHTTRLIAKELSLNENDYTTSFQSRLNKEWLTPFSDRVIESLAKEGKKSVLVFSPSFTADCLETLYEIKVEYEEIFQKNGGTDLVLVESLNSGNDWVNALKRMIVLTLNEKQACS